jgi:hypothetical protein
LQLIYVSSRQAIDPGLSVPGYVISNWAVLQLPKMLAVNLGQNVKFVGSACILLPFIRTSMTDQYAENPKVFGRWQPRMLEPNEAAKAFMQLLARPQPELDKGLFELMAEGAPDKVDVTWKRVELDLREERMEWSIDGSLQFQGQRQAVKK